MKIGVFLPNWIGDAAMCTPALRAIKRQFGPGTAIVGVLRPYVADVLAGTQLLDEQIFFDRKSKDPTRHTGAVWHQLRAVSSTPSFC